MANFLLPQVYGNCVIEKVGIQSISLQLHITAKCDQHCKHCYMHSSPLYRSQIESPLNKNEWFALIDEYFAFLSEYHCHYTTIGITGGDPLLSPYFWDIIEYIDQHYKKNTCVVIMGNPYHINNDVAKHMKALGVSCYQVSIDGLKSTHDALRREGSFDESVHALQILYNARISTTVFMTVSKLNAGDVIPLYDYLSKREFVDYFGIDRMIPTGSGKNLVDELFTPTEFRDLLFELYKYEVLHPSKLIIAKKEQLWRLLFYELGLVDPIDMSKKNHFITGCNCGTETTSVLADGTVMPCRKLEKVAGKYPERSFKELFMHNDVTQLFLSLNNYKKCITCEVNPICRGCPAMKYSVNGDFFSFEPYCWKEKGSNGFNICD